MSWSPAAGLKRRLCLALALSGAASAFHVQPWTPEHTPPEFLRAWTGTNGHIGAAWITATLPADAPLPRMNALARALVRSGFQARPDLDQIEVSLYRPQDARPADMSALFTRDPQMTLSVRRAEWTTLSAMNDAGRWPTPRVWYARFSPPVQPVPAQAGALALPLPALQRALDRVVGGARAGVAYRGSPFGDRVALTIDDGPHPLFTPLLLDTLARARVRATMFVIGRGARAYPFLVRDMIAGGHEIGNHTYHHLRLRPLGPAQISWEIRAGQRAVQQAAGVTPSFFRPPGGGATPAVYQAARQAGLVTAWWTDDPADYQPLPPGELKRRLERNLSRGGIVLLHDNAASGLEAVQLVVEMARARGLNLGPLGWTLR